MYMLLLALAGAVEYSLLRLGRGLEAPQVVRGEWQLQVPGPAHPCFSSGTMMSIEQSGPDVEIVLPGASKLTGTLAGPVLRAKSSTRAAKCGAMAVLSQLNGNSMRGSLQVAGAAPIGFTATRAAGEKR
jgi:hypothetical protein